MFRSQTPSTIALLCFLCALLFTFRSPAATYYLSNAGSDSASGLVGSPWATLTKASAVVQPGDTVVLTDGTYYVYPEVIFRTSGTASLPITIEGVDTNAVISGMWIDASFYRVQNMTVGTTNEPTANPLLQLNGSNSIGSNIVFTGHWALTNGTANVKMAGLDGTNDLLVNSTFVNLSNTTAVQFGGLSNVATGVLITNCYDLKNYVVFGNNHVISNCICVYQFDDGLGNHPDFVQSFGDNDTTGNITAWGSNFLAIANYVGNCPGMQMFFLTPDNSSAYGFFDTWTFVDSVFVGPNNSGDSGYPHTYVLNDIFYNCSQNQGQPIRFINTAASGSGNANQGIASNSVCENCVFINCGGDSSNPNVTNPDDGYIENDGAPGVVIDYNYVCLTNFGQLSASYYGANFGSHTINGGNPGINGLTALAFSTPNLMTLLSSSILRNAGVTNSLTPTTDFNGTNWQQPDIGPIAFYTAPSGGGTGGGGGPPGVLTFTVGAPGASCTVIITNGAPAGIVITN